jgi:hypothetical protein
MQDYPLDRIGSCIHPLLGSEFDNTIQFVEFLLGYLLLAVAGVGFIADIKLTLAMRLL